MQYIFAVMPTFKKTKTVVVKGLYAHAYTVDGQVFEGDSISGRHIIGVTFNRYFL